MVRGPKSALNSPLGELRKGADFVEKLDNGTAAFAWPD